MDLEANSRRSILERMLIDENAEPMALPLSLLEDITNRFSPDHEIGRGGFAVVYKGIVGKGIIAIKKLSKTFDIVHENKFHKEIECLMKAKHKNIVRFMGYCSEAHGIAEDYEGKFVMANVLNWLLCFEYVPSGNLQKYITDASGGLEWRVRFQIINGICKGLHYLHTNRILHLDLKPANILLDNDMIPKITDFGLSRYLNEEKTHDTTKHLFGTPGYMAPEFYGGKITFASDIYSLGVIIIEMLTGVKGYPEDDNVTESWMNRLEGDMQLEQVRVCTKIGIECIDPDPKKRPVARRIINMLGKTASADETSMSSSLVEPQASLLVQPDQEGIGKLMESLSQEDIEERPETEDVEERPVNGHSQQREENTDLCSSWEEQDTERKVTRKGKSIFSYYSGRSGVLDKLKIWNIFKEDGHMLGEGEILETENVKAFTFNELRTATRNFQPDSVLGEGGFGRVYKGWIDEKTLTPTKPGTGMAIAVKKLNQESLQGHEEWMAEVNYLGQLSHPNIIKLVGYCAEDKQLLLVYEFMPRGSLFNHLFRRSSHSQPLPWNLRMKIAHGVAKALAFLHSDKAKIIHRSFNSSDILLDGNYDAKLSDFGLAKVVTTRYMSHVTTRVMGIYGYDVKLSDFSLAKVVPTRYMSHVTTRVMGIYGYAAPEYIATGHLTTKCDVFSFGVVLLEMLSGRCTLDKSRPNAEHNLVEWARPHLLSRRSIIRVLDARLGEQYSLVRARKAAALALQCLSKNPRDRPTMEEVVTVLEQLHDAKEGGNSQAATGA